MSGQTYGAGTASWSGVLDASLVVEVEAPDGSVLWLDQGSGLLYQSLSDPPLSGDDVPPYVVLSPDAGVAVTSGRALEQPRDSWVLDPSTGAVYTDAGLDELVGLSVTPAEATSGSDASKRRRDTTVEATPDEGVHHIGHGVVYVEATGAYYDEGGERLTGPDITGPDGEPFDPGTVLSAQDYERLTGTTQGFDELVGADSPDATLPDGTPYTDLGVNVTSGDLWARSSAPNEEASWSGVLDASLVVEVEAPDGSVLWLDQGSGLLYQSLSDPPLSGDDVPPYVVLSPDAGVAVTSGRALEQPRDSWVLDPSTGAVYTDAGLDELVGLSVTPAEATSGSDASKRRRDTTVEATPDEGVHHIGHGVVYVEATGAYYDEGGERLTGPDITGPDGEPFDPGTVLSAQDYERLTGTTQGFDELVGADSTDATLPDGTPYTDLGVNVTSGDLWARSSAPNEEASWSGVLDASLVVEVEAPDGSVLWLDQGSGLLYQSLSDPPLSGDDVPPYVVLSPDAGVAVTSGRALEQPRDSWVLDPSTGAVYTDAGLDELVGLSVTPAEATSGSDASKRRRDTTVEATPDEGVHHIGHGVVYVEATGAYYDEGGERLTGPDITGPDGEPFDPGTVLSAQDYERLTGTTQGFDELVGADSPDATLPDGTPYTDLLAGVTDGETHTYESDRWSHDEASGQWLDATTGILHLSPSLDGDDKLSPDALDPGQPPVEPVDIPEGSAVSVPGIEPDQPTDPDDATGTTSVPGIEPDQPTDPDDATGTTSVPGIEPDQPTDPDDATGTTSVPGIEPDQPTDPDDATGTTSVPGIEPDQPTDPDDATGTTSVPGIEPDQPTDPDDATGTTSVPGIEPDQPTDPDDATGTTSVPGIEPDQPTDPDGYPGLDEVVADSGSDIDAIPPELLNRQFTTSLDPSTLELLRRRAERVNESSVDPSTEPAIEADGATATAPATGDAPGIVAEVVEVSVAQATPSGETTVADVVAEVVEVTVAEPVPTDENGGRSPLPGADEPTFTQGDEMPSRAVTDPLLPPPPTPASVEATASYAAEPDPEPNVDIGTRPAETEDEPVDPIAAAAAVANQAAEAGEAAASDPVGFVGSLVDSVVAGTTQAAENTQDAVTGAARDLVEDATEELPDGVVPDTMDLAGLSDAGGVLAGYTAEQLADLVERRTGIDPEEAAADGVDDAAMVADRVVDKVGNTAEWVGDTSGKVVDKVGNTAERVGDTSGKVVDKVGNTAERVGDTSGKVVDKVGNTAERVGDTSGKVVDATTEGATRVTGFVANTSAEMVDKVGDTAEGLAEATRAGVEATADAAETVVASHAEARQDATDTTRDLAETSREVVANLAFGSGASGTDSRSDASSIEPAADEPADQFVATVVEFETVLADPPDDIQSGREAFVDSALDADGDGYVDTGIPDDEDGTDTDSRTLDTSGDFDLP